MQDLKQDKLPAVDFQEIYARGLKKPVPYTPHNGENRQYMRDIILGVNDGLVSMFLLVFGMAGGNANAHSILLAAITGAIAGAISMAAGEYLATKSQAEVVAADLELEKEHFVHHRDVELEELRVTLQGLGLKDPLLSQVVEAIGSNDEALLKFMMAFEFGYTEQDERNPLIAMLMSGALFVTGALPSVVPFACTSNLNIAVWVAGGLCAFALFLVGAIKTISTKASIWYSGGENVLLGVIGAAASYAVGMLYDVIVKV